jgi:hypothetical protein
MGTGSCGVTRLAGKAVGAPFVGAVAACLAVIAPGAWKRAGAAWRGRMEASSNKFD